ncbi:mitochondrial nicotinamide adenine dinucleotide transporter SLC25A51-like [Tubulanus polymorphus]|uniref:mitochondrial nicotinamide adenine dinucleotide transporter SLC25A51-like n=1 Tax=Tubulanus polymorphus TaxID=672921 RepID=UPI003DA59B18
MAPVSPLDAALDRDDLQQTTPHDFTAAPPGDVLEEFICGWGAAVINITITFPINKAMFRQQLHGIRFKSAVAQLQHEGTRNLYRGFLPPLLQKTSSLAIMFGMYNQYGKFLTNHAPDLPILANQGLASAMAGCTEAVLTPFERVQTLLQDRKHQKRFHNTFHALRVLRYHGYGEYYRGMVPICVRNAGSNVMFFTLRGPLKQALPAPRTFGGHLIADFVSGAVLGAIISTVFFPINVIKTRMQSVVGSEFLTTRRVFAIIFHERHCSWRRMFYGVHVNYSRSLVSWGIINAAYEMLKNLFAERKNR